MADENTESTKPVKPWMITKNVLFVSFAAMVNFTANVGAMNLQSSINYADGLGTASLATVYTGVFFSNTFLSVGLINWLGTKWTMVFAFISCSPYMAAQIYPTFYTLIPAALILGIFAAPVWPATLTHISVCAEVHSRISNILVEELVPRFFGMFYMIYQMDQVWGNLISSVVLTFGNNTAAVTSLNETAIPLVCGSKFLPSTDARDALSTQPQEKIWLLSGIYIGCTVGAALIVAVGVDPLSRYESISQKSEQKQGTLKLLASSMKLMAEPTQLLLILITIFIGMEQAYFGVDFTAAFVSCAAGTGYVGFVFMVFGISNVIGSLLMRYLSKVIRRFYLIGAATLLHTIIFCTMLMWRPHVEEVYILYIIAVLWGISDSIWIVQINACYAILFPGQKEAAFSNWQIWQSIGYIFMYIASPRIFTSHKIYIMLAIMVIGVICYFTIEYQQNRTKKKEENKRNSYLYTSIIS